jgi:hypothetical protein
MQYTDLMLDIETLGTGPGCVILSIAAVPFFKSGENPDQYRKCFYENIDIGSCLELGMKVDPATLHWWLDKSALFLHLQQSVCKLPHALDELASFIRAQCTEDVRVWGKGPSFDNAILRDAFDRVKIKLPWRYSRERCVRTYLDGYEELLREHLPFQGTPHDPLNDAIHQVKSIHKVQSLILTHDPHELH